MVLLGASSDIGAVIARWATNAGHRVLCVSRSYGAISAGAIDRTTHIAEGVDLLTAAGQTRLVAAVDRFVADDSIQRRHLVVVHCVGDFWRHRPLDQLNANTVRRTMLAHYATLAESVVSLLPFLASAGTGRIVAFSCNSVVYAYPHMAPFTAAKAAIETFMRCVAHEYSDRGIATTTIALPTVLTPKVRKAKPHGDLASYLTPDDVAAVVLREMDASPYVTGNVVRMIRHSDTFYGTGYLQRNPPEA